MLFTFSLFSSGEVNPKKEHKITTKTRNAMRCNNRDDLLQLSFTLKVSVFSGAYIQASRRSMMELILRKYKAAKYIHKKAPS